MEFDEHGGGDDNERRAGDGRGHGQHDDFSGIRLDQWLDEPGGEATLTRLQSGKFRASFTNSGTLNNGGTINIAFNSFSNSGLFNNRGTLNNFVTLDNAGTFNNSSHASLISSGTVTPTGSAIVDIQDGPLSGTGTINGNVLRGQHQPHQSGKPDADGKGYANAVLQHWCPYEGILN